MKLFYKKFSLEILVIFGRKQGFIVPLGEVLRVTQTHYWVYLTQCTKRKVILPYTP